MTSFADDHEFMARLEIHEGFRGRPYKDTVGKTTIGIGRNLDDNPLTHEEARYLAAGQIRQFEEQLDRNIPWWRTLSVPRQRVLLDMCFNMGWATLAGFKRTLAAIYRGDYEEAAIGMLGSKWAGQVGGRAKFLAEVMKSGVWPGDAV